MRRADRLFALVQIIRGRRLSTAEHLAQRLEVSVRTVYRDIADLQHQGVPIQGAAGVGYRLGPGFELPPLMFSTDEAQALVVAVRMAQAWLDPAMAASAEDALGKVLSVLPAKARAAAESVPLFAPMLEPITIPRDTLAGLRDALARSRKVRLGYRDESGRTSERVVSPLGCFYWGRVWTLAAWCELRHDFRSFRIDRINSMVLLDEAIDTTGGRSLADFLRRYSDCD